MKSMAETSPLSKISSSIIFVFISGLAIAILTLKQLNIETDPQSSHGISASKTSFHTDTDLFIWSEIYGDWCLIKDKSTRPEQVSTQSDQPLQIWPDSERQVSDRIINQLRLTAQHDKIFQIYTSDRFLPDGRTLFLDDRCTVSHCAINYDIEKADALILHNSDVPIEPKIRRPEQIWIAYLLESPPHTYDKRFSRKYRGRHEFNWTATYRSDSDIVAPYSKFVPYINSIEAYMKLKLSVNPDLKELELQYSQASKLHKNLILNKEPKVAWMASNCHAANSRLEYALELSKFIQVDIFGRCGNMTCDKRNQTECLEVLNKNYKFYLSFENSNCREYITEKLYRNAYGHNDVNHLILPIVMGASKSDYQALVPPASFLHVDDFKSAQDLADYLKLLDQNDALYYSYFRWKTLGRFIDTKFMCRVCAMLHQAYVNRRSYTYRNIKDWWISNSCDH